MSKLSIVPIDTERLASKLLDAISSFKKAAIPSVLSSPRQEEQAHTAVPRVLAWTEEEQQVPPYMDENRTYEFGPIEGAPSYVSTNRSLGPKRPLKDLIRPDSIFEDDEPEKVPASKNGENWETDDTDLEAQISQNEIIEEFSRDHDVLQRLRVSSQELHALSRVSMLGTLSSKQDLLFMLRQIREAEEPSEVEVTTPEPTIEENVETSGADIGELAANIRREAHARLVELDSAREVEAEPREPVWRRVNAFLSWRSPLSLSLRER